MLYGLSAILNAIARAKSSASAVEWSRSEIGSLCVARPAILGFGIWARPEIALVKILFVTNRVSVGFFYKVFTLETPLCRTFAHAFLLASGINFSVIQHLLKGRLGCP